jgi:hypothetical protein
MGVILDTVWPAAAGFAPPRAGEGQGGGWAGPHIVRWAVDDRCTPHETGGAYAAGYYAYLWAELLDADGFAAFTETGDVFHPELAARLETIYGAGDTRDPMELYRAFRGRDPRIEALLAQRGRGQQMGVDIADAAPEQRPAIDKAQHFLVGDDGRLWQSAQCSQKRIAPSQIAERQLADHERVPENLAAVE